MVRHCAVRHIHRAVEVVVAEQSVANYEIVGHGGCGQALRRGMAAAANVVISASVK